jgi:hypothetical protein
VIRTIFPAGSLRAGQLQPAFFDDQEAILNVRANFRGHLPLFIKPEGCDEWIGITPDEGTPPPGEYRIGITIDESNLGSLVLRPKNKRGPDYCYRLGKMAYTDVREKT